MASLQTAQRRPQYVVSPPPSSQPAFCKPELPDGTMKYFVSNEFVQEDAGSAVQWLLARHPKSDIAKAAAEMVEGLCCQLQMHLSDLAQLTRVLKALCLIFYEIPETPKQLEDASCLLGFLTSSLRRYPAEAQVQELACRVCASLAFDHAEILVGNIVLFVEAVSRFPSNAIVQETANSCIFGMLSAAVDGVAPAVCAVDRGIVSALAATCRHFLDNEIVSIAAVRALAVVLEQHPRSCGEGHDVDIVSALCNQLAQHPHCAAVQVHAHKALASMFYRQPLSATRACDLKVERVLLAALQNHGNSAEVQAEASNAVAMLMEGYSNAAEAVALAGIPDWMIDGLQTHFKIKPVQEAVCHALSQLFGINNAILPTSMRLRSFGVTMELIRRELTSAGTQLYASLCLANICAHHSGSAQDAVNAGAFELLLQAHRCHHKVEHIQSNALFAAARIIESYPLGIARGVEAGITSRFEKALHENMFDERGMVHVACALAQIYVFLILQKPGHRESLHSLAKLLERHPKSNAGATRAGAVRALTQSLRMVADPGLLMVASCSLGHIFVSQASYAKDALDNDVVDLLIAAMRSHLGHRHLQAQVAQSLVHLMQALPASADAIAISGGPDVLNQALNSHPDAANVKLNVSTAFRILGRHVPALTPFPFVPAPPQEG